jgi:hypothetical protein
MIIRPLSTLYLTQSAKCCKPSLNFLCINIQAPYTRKKAIFQVQLKAMQGHMITISIATWQGNNDSINPLGTICIATWQGNNGSINPLG